MKLGPAELDAAVEQGIISREQAESLARLAEQGQGTASALTLEHLAYYLGGLVVIGAMGWYVTNAWKFMSGWGFMAVAALYAGLFLFIGSQLWHKPGGRVPGGLLVTMAVCMTPMFVYGAELVTDFWPQGQPAAYGQFFTRLKGCWLFMELATIGAGVFALRVYRFPFLTAPIFAALWFLSMDLTPLLFGQTDFSWTQRRWVSLWFGLGMLALTYVVDRRTREDFAFWGYIFGLLAFWGGLTLMDSTSELARLAYCGINVVLLLAAILLERRVFLVFGGLGVALYIGHLAHRLFRDSFAFPFILSALGLGIMGLGLLYRRHGAAIDAAVLSRMPDFVRNARPGNRQPPPPR